MSQRTSLNSLTTIFRLAGLEPAYHNLSMAHTRKKAGIRKDKKNERMREDLAMRKAMAKPAHPTTDQGDVMDYKPGSASDANRHQ